MSTRDCNAIFKNYCVARGKISTMLHSAMAKFWLSARKKFKGGNNRPSFFKTIGYCFYCSFYCFSKILRGQTPFRGAKVVLGGAPCPPVAESQNLLIDNLPGYYVRVCIVQLFRRCCTASAIQCYTQKFVGETATR